MMSETDWNVLNSLICKMKSGIGAVFSAQKSFNSDNHTDFIIGYKG